MSINRILLVHNYYQQPGGEDQVFATEADLIESRLEYVRQYTVHNAAIKDMHQLALAQATFWNKNVYQDLRRLIRKDGIELVHFHNTFPLISPAGYYAARAEGVPVVQTLHNYRLLCLNALFLRDGHICKQCQEKIIPWPGMVYKCYRGSRAATGVLAGMLVYHRLAGTWQNMVDTYIVLSEFARTEFIRGGLPAEKIVVKPNFVYPDPEPGTGAGGFALFVGRLSDEKGVGTLLAAWKKLARKTPLKIVGDGPLRQLVSEATYQVPGIDWPGWISRDEVYNLIGEAAFLVIPSECFEGFPRTVVESFAKGTPIIASNLGSLSSLIRPYHTGLHFCPSDPEDLAKVVEWTIDHPDKLLPMRQAARAEFEAKYTAEQNYQTLMGIYEAAVRTQMARTKRV